MYKLILFLVFFVESTLLIGQSTNFKKEKNGYTIQAIDSRKVIFDNFFSYPQKIDSISKNYNNSHKRSLAIERFQIKNSKTKIIIDSISRIVCLKNGLEIKLTPNPKKDEYGYTFEREFYDQNLLLFRVQWSEGNNYLLLNTNNGNFHYIIGRPYFHNNYFVCINDDIVANYSFNGIQMFQILDDSILELWKIKTDWGPESIKWIDDNSFIIKGYTWADTLDTKKEFFKKITIRNTINTH